MKHCARPVWGIAVLFTFCCAVGAQATDFVSREAAEKHYRQMAERPMRAKGLDPNKDEDVLKALEQGEMSALNFVYQRKLTAAVPILRKLFQQTHEPGEQLAIAEGLKALDPDRSVWWAAVNQLLDKQEPRVRLRAAVLLRDCGNGAGWPVIVDLVKGSQFPILISEALNEARRFEGLISPVSKEPIRLNVEIAELETIEGTRKQQKLLEALRTGGTYDPIR